MDTLEIQFFSHPDFTDREKEFVNDYDLVDIILSGDSRFDKRKLKPRSERVCRFCGLSYPRVKFKSDAHLLSEMIGNKDLFADFECSDCNHRLSKYENDLANFLGVSRTILGVKTKDGVPNFKSAGKILTAKAKSFFGNDIIIIARDELDSEAIKILDRKAGRLAIKYIKNSYRPNDVYKALLKWAMSSLDENEIKTNYEYAIGYLNGKGVMNGCVINGYKLPFQWNFVPRVYLFKKRDQQRKIHTHVMVFYFQNQIISFPVPLHKEDFSFYNGKRPIAFPFYPPLFTQFEIKETTLINPYTDNLSSKEKIKNAEEEIILELNQEELKKAAIYDSVTDTYHEKEFDPAPIKYMILVRNDVSVNPKELMRFIKEHMKK